MYEKIARLLTKKLAKLKVLEQEDFDVYVYGITLIISLIVVLLSILFTAALLNKMLETSIYLIGFLLTRFICGGYHAKHFYSCFISTNLTYWLFLLILSLTYNCNSYKLFIFVITLLSVIIINIFAPIENHNNYMSSYRKKRNKKYILILSVFAINILFLYSKTNFSLSPPFLLGIFIASLTVLLAKAESLYNKLKGESK